MNFITKWFKKIQPCKHEFKLSQLEMTMIPELKKPTSNDYQEWISYNMQFYKHESETKRVKWPCAKCKKIFYGQCGLSISPKHGPIIE